ncbi:MAG: carbon-nitrogen hydrolase family protein [candidate division Zixibacteria bacterium]|nr:carbon-nitrogen hydrolase family protein [candidate division Zixibacteria bacterium]
MKVLPYRVAAIQKAPVFLNKEATVDSACELIAEAGREKASLAVFPEAFISGYPDWVWLLPTAQKAMINELYGKLLENAVTIPDWSTDKLCEAAKSAGIYVVIGVNERNSEASNSSLCNSMLYIDPNGNILGKHRKLIPTGSERLMWAQGDGSTLVSFDTDLGKMGGLLCWENFMPLARYIMYSSGVQIYVAPTWDSSESWQIAMRHIAREGGMFVVSCAPAIKMDDIPDSFEFKKLYPDDREWINKGNSCIVNPKGKIIAGPLEAKQEILYADIDLNEISNEKWMFDVAGHYSRPDVFKFSLNED